MFESVDPTPPGEVVAWLARVDTARLGESELVDVLVACERVQAWVASVQLRALASVDAATDVDPGADPGPGFGADPEGRVPVLGWDSHQRGDRKRSAATELGLVLKIPAKYAFDRMSSARLLVEHAPAAVAQLAAGRLSPVQARDLAEAMLGLPVQVGPELLERVLPAAADQSSGQFRAALRRSVMTLAPQTAEILAAAAVADRKVCVRPDEHGTGTLWARLPAPELVEVDAAIRARADQYLTADPTDPRTADQRRADALIELILHDNHSAEAGTDTAGTDTAGIGRSTRRRRAVRPVVQVTVGLSTLLGADDQPGDLAGFGAIPASMARRIAADETGTWRRLVTDPLGQLIDYGRTRYKPPKDLDEFLRARDRTCVFPNCNRPATACELDHLHPWADGGHTNPDNLATECANHHHLRHDHGWNIHRDPTTNTITWTSPTGRTYKNPPAAA